MVAVIAAKPALFPVMFVTVVDASVEEPEIVALVEKSDVSAPIPAVKLESVVDASVDDPETARLVKFRVFALRVVNAAV